MRYFSIENNFIFYTLFFVCGFINGVQIKLTTMIYVQISTITTNWENHKYMSDYENAKSLKIFVFRLINGFVALYKVSLYNQ